jgi:chemosensory pili system protein ChpA (sensor histidine kinase/response regulator)
VGQLRIQAGHEGNEAVIRVGDDGRGLDLIAIRGKARQRGVALRCSPARPVWPS